MKKRILAYLEYIDNIIEKEDRNWDREIEKHLIQIGFFAHERLVHLIVMVLFAIGTLMGILYLNYSGKMIILALVVAFMVLLVPYVMHYYLLENSVQKMYVQYDIMLNKKEEAFLMKEDK
ncbi:MAG: hypothetical protein IJX12_07325 [Lachnospiraceae bacterium]|nr:hypothetical protein [Lachnospiraceae bacterium]